MNKQTELFVEELKQNPEVLGVILFGSWARGNHRLGSDVDLVVILKNGYKRAAEERNGQIFEIIYTTEDAAFEYWEDHKDDAAGLWAVAKTLYDKDGTIKRLKERAEDMLQIGKKPIDTFQLGQFHFDAEDALRYVESILESDPTTANLILTNKVFALTELFFDIRQLWIPAPKQRMAKIKEAHHELYVLLEQFYKDSSKIVENISIVKRMIPLIFEK